MTKQTSQEFEQAVQKGKLDPGKYPMSKAVIAYQMQNKSLDTDSAMVVSRASVMIDRLANESAADKDRMIATIATKLMSTEKQIDMSDDLDFDRKFPVLEQVVQDTIREDRKLGHPESEGKALTQLVSAIVGFTIYTGELKASKQGLAEMKEQIEDILAAEEKFLRPSMPQGLVAEYTQRKKAVTQELFYRENPGIAVSEPFEGMKKDVAAPAAATFKKRQP